MYRARLQKHARLLKAVEYDRVFEKSVRSSDQYFTVLARPNDQGQSRLGLAITKRKVRLAVNRNRLKRLTRETFRLTQQSTAVDCVVMAGSRAAGASNEELITALQQHWKQIEKKCADF